MALVIRVILFLFSLTVLVVVVALGPAPMMFVNIPSIFLITLIPIPIMLSIHGRKALMLTTMKGSRRNRFIDQWSRILFSTVAVTVIWGIIEILANLTDPLSIGPPLAIAMLTLFYACLIKLFILEPLRDWSEDGTVS